MKQADIRALVFKQLNSDKGKQVFREMQKERSETLKQLLKNKGNRISGESPTVAMIDEKGK